MQRAQPFSYSKFKSFSSFIHQGRITSIYNVRKDLRHEDELMVTDSSFELTVDVGEDESGDLH